MPAAARPAHFAYSRAVPLALALAAGGLITAPATAGPNDPPIVDTPGAPGLDVGSATDFLPVSDLAAGLAAGRYTSRELVERFTARVLTLDRQPPDQAPRAVIVLNPDALADAQALDAERRAGRVRGPLHGVPVWLKDNIDTAAMPTTAGSLALAGPGVAPPATDAPLVTRLRAAGLVILGKTNLSEWANFRSTHSISGWSAVGGQTTNAFDPARTPCGSSSGSGTAVAAGFGPLAIGTETDGSVTCPSAMAGLVGVKPTVGRVPGAGIVPISTFQDTAGPMARTVTDAALLLNALAAGGPSLTPGGAAPVVTSLPPKGEFAPGGFDATKNLSPSALQGVRLGVVASWKGFSPAVDARLDEALARLRAAGATVVPVTLPTEAAVGKEELPALLCEFRPAVAAYLRTRPGAPPDLAALIAFNQAHAAAEMPVFGQELFEQAEATKAESPARCRAHRARAVRLAGVEGIDAALKNYRVAALIGPTYGPPGLYDPKLGGEAIGGGGSTSLAAVAGYPHVTVPMARVAGLPVGLSFVGPAWSEARLLGYAFAFEQARGALETDDASAPPVPAPNRPGTATP